MCPRIDENHNDNKIGDKGRNRNFVDKLHSRSRGNREGNWARWFFKRMNNGIRWGKERRNDRRRSRAFFVTTRREGRRILLTGV